MAINFKANHWVFYSIGNFVFNSPGKYKELKAPPYSFIVNLAFEFNNNNIWISPHLYPIVTDNRQTKYQTRTVDERNLMKCAHYLLVEIPL